MVPHAIVTMVTQDTIVFAQLDIPVNIASHPQVSTCKSHVFHANHKPILTN
jgi:mannitol/fructose-specific phosphotransferase system IIA component (Ntr-type)